MKFRRSTCLARPPATAPALAVSAGRGTGSHWARSAGSSYSSSVRQSASHALPLPAHRSFVARKAKTIRRRLSNPGKGKELLSPNLCRTYSTLLDRSGSAGRPAETEKRYCNATASRWRSDSGVFLCSVPGESAPRGSSAGSPSEACQGVLR